MADTNTYTPPTIDTSGKLDGIPEEHYKAVFQILDGLGKREQFSSTAKYVQTQYVLANYIYLIYERLNLNMVRDIDYNQLQTFAIKNKDFVRMVFNKQFGESSAEALENWLQPEMDILECAMYRTSNRYTKNIFH